MNKIKLNINMTLLVVAILTCIGMLSCKTEYVKLGRPYNDIKRFTILGYGNLDSIPAIVSNDEIIINWNAKAEYPATIKPSIIISDGAVISPASGTEVAFAESTVYTVTAEDGSVRQFKLKPVFNEAIPRLIGAPDVHRWLNDQTLTLVGEYFLSAGSFSKIKLYGQRISDGFEFDIPIDETLSSNTNIVAKIPNLSGNLDTGAHRLYVKVGEYASNFKEVTFYYPYVNEIAVNTATVDKIDEVKLGEDLTFNVNFKEGLEHLGEKYVLAKKFLTRIILYSLSPNGTSENIFLDGQNLNYVSFSSPNKIVVNMNNDFFRQYTNYQILNIGTEYQRKVLVYDIGESFTWQPNFTGFLGGVNITDPIMQPLSIIEFAQSGQQIRLDQDLTISYSFKDEATKALYDKTLYNINLGLINNVTGERREIELSTSSLTQTDGQIQFKLPNQQSLIGFAIRAINANFYNESTDQLLTPRTILNNTSTVIVN